MQREFQYSIVTNKISEDIFYGKYPLGSRLPSFRELADAYKVNFHTIRKAVAVLAEKGYVITRTGSGTHVMRLPLKKDLKQLSERMGEDERVKNRIGLIHTSDLSAYASALRDNIIQVAEELSVDLKIRCVGNDKKQIMDSIHKLKAQGCSAVIPLFSPLNQENELALWLMQYSPLPISCAKLFPGYERNCCESPEIFGTADQRAVEIACCYFHNLGYSNIVFFGPKKSNLPPLQRKVCAYSVYMNSHNIDGQIFLSDFSESDMKRVAEKLNSVEKPSAVIAYDDIHALALLECLKNSAISIPDQVSILGFNNSPDSAKSTPALSSMCHSYYYSAQSLLLHASGLGENKLVQSKSGNRLAMVIRASCGGISAGAAKLGRILEKLGLEDGFSIEGRITGN